MTSQNLKRQIAVHQGWDDVAPEPDWTGTLEDWWSKNPAVTYGEIRDLCADLDEGRGHQIGGGNQGIFTIRRAVSTTETASLPLSEYRRDEIAQMFKGKTWAYTAVLVQETDETVWHLGVAVANEGGYCPVPLMWFQTTDMDRAYEVADALNADRGLDVMAAAKIVCSTMNPRATPPRRIPTV